MLPDNERRPPAGPRSVIESPAKAIEPNDSRFVANAMRWPVTP